MLIVTTAVGGSGEDHMSSLADSKTLSDVAEERECVPTTHLVRSNLVPPLVPPGTDVRAHGQMNDPFSGDSVLVRGYL